jgi:apolipoprotein D and lipocalin family protein
MNTHALSHPEPVDRDERLRELELRVIARDEALQRRLHGLKLRVQDAVSPKRWKVPLLAGALAVAAGAWWLLGHRRSALVAGAAAPEHRPARAGNSRWLLRAIGLAWPLLPARWRGRVSPGGAAAMASVGLPLLESLLTPPAHPPLATMPHVDLARYMGTWHEIARLPASFERPCVGQPSATYVLRGGSVEVIDRCLGADGQLREAVGEARVVPASGNAKLQLSLWPRLLRLLPFAWADYWIIHVDDRYRVAVVGHPNRRYLWLLARDRRLSPTQCAQLVDIAAAHGFPVHRLQFQQAR